MPAKVRQDNKAGAAKTVSKMDTQELSAELSKLKLTTSGSETELRQRLGNAQLLSAVTSAKEETEEASTTLAAAITKASGLQLATIIRELNLVKSLETALLTTGKTAAAGREASVKLIASLIEAGGQPVLPLLLPLLAPLIDVSGDKVKTVKKAAVKCVKSYMETTSKYAPTLLLGELLKKPQSWQANESRLKLIVNLVKIAPAACARTLHIILPVICVELHDVKKKVADAARKCLKALCKLCTNEDVVPLVPTLMSALENADEIGECVNTLASTTFVQEVEGTTLSIMTPILVSGFASRQEKTKRACARIVENMAKLVEEPADLAANFLPKILPRLEAAEKNISDPEARKVCGDAKAMLVKKSTLKAGQHLPGTATVYLAMLTPELKNVDAKDADVQVYSNYVAELMAALVVLGNFEISVWTETLAPFLKCLKAEDCIETLRAAGEKSAMVEEEKEEDLDEGEELCNCEFSLAYGNKVLLRKTKLRLVRGQNYGLIGKNDCGKTSLMRAIADHRVDGFPEEDELRTVFVETDVQGELSDLSVIDYVMADEVLKKLNDGKGVDRDAMIKTLHSVGFTDDSPAPIKSTVGQLSGGWRMKLALARAMQLNADILLLDEPTNHLDSYNVKWVEDYLASLDGVTCVMVSHDSGFLNRICQNIIQIDNFRLGFHRGNLESFVAKNPDAKSFFELKTEKFKFTFPQPNRLKGINSKGKPIMKMTDISFTYPGAPKPQLNHVTIQVSLGSRVACVGVNGAGKSTMIKLLTGELEPDVGSGDVWTHPNMIYGYIAQHAFHHIEKHLDKTANEYICWRYRHGNDREALNKITNVVTPEEQKQMDKPVAFEVKDLNTGTVFKKKAVIKSFTQSRRINKQKKEQEYEIKVDKEERTYWILRTVLEKAGWEKVLKQVDDKITIRESQFQNPLTKTNVTKHLAEVGLEEEFSTHMRIGALSGGQKVKVVLGAALWNRPHVLILDEPTNYLDRDSLGALATAIREFEGGVVMITHNSQFCDNLCPQVWHLENNTLNVKGDAEWMNMEKFAEEKKSTTNVTVDKYGNTVVVKVPYDQLSKKDQRRLKKARDKLRKIARKSGKHVDELEFDDGYDDDLF